MLRNLHGFFKNALVSKNRPSTLVTMSAMFFSDSSSARHSTESTFIKHRKCGEIQIQILFEEIFYEEKKFRVLCVERPFDVECEDSRRLCLTNLKECVEFLERFGFVDKVDIIVRQFSLLARKEYNEKFPHMSKLCRSVYERCLSIIGENPSVLGCNFVKNLKLSVESYVQHSMYSSIMKDLVTNLTDNIGRFNKIVKNLSGVELRDLVRCDASWESIPKVRCELSHIASHTTILGKLSCLKRCINDIKSSSERVGTDDVIPILAFLVVKSGVTTWPAQFAFLEAFHFSENDSANEYSYWVATLEAVLNYVENGFQIHLKKRSRAPFEAIYEEDVSAVINALNEATQVRTKRLCHPLCSCDACETIVNEGGNAFSLSYNDEYGQKALHVAASLGTSSIADVLLDYGANVDAVDNSGVTALMHAARNGHKNVVLLLLYAKASVDLCDNDGNTALHLASLHGQADTVKAMLYFAEHSHIPLNVNAVNASGDTPLHMACKLCYRTIVECLYDYNADPFLKNKRDVTACDLACSAIVKAALKRRRFQINLLHICDGNADAEKLSKGGDLTVAVARNDFPAIKRAFGFAPNHVSYKCHPLCSCEACLWEQPKTDLSPDVKDNAGYGILHACARHGRTEMARFLLRLGADVDVRSKREGWTPLHVAASHGGRDMAELLLTTGCDVNGRDTSGETALHKACSHGNAQVVECLLKYEADVKVKNNVGLTAVNLARRRGFDKLFNMVE